MSINGNPTDTALEPREMAAIDGGEDSTAIEEFPPAWSPFVPRHMVTYVNSETAGTVRSATVVTVTNQAERINHVVVSYLDGFDGTSRPIAVGSFRIPPAASIDFVSRSLPEELTAISAVCCPELVLAEGRAIISSVLPEIAVESHVFYTAGRADDFLLSIEHSDVVAFPAMAGD
jgi:hypothetical protein